MNQKTTYDFIKFKMIQDFGDAARYGSRNGYDK